MGFLDTATGFISDTDWAETAESVADTAENVGNTIDAFDDGPSISNPGYTPPIRNPNPTPQPEPEPTDPQPQPKPRGGGFAGMGQTGVILLALAGAFIVTKG